MTEGTIYQLTCLLPSVLVISKVSSDAISMPYPSASVIHLELTQGNNILVDYLHKYIKPAHTQISSQLK